MFDLPPVLMVAIHYVDNAANVFRFAGIHDQMLDNITVYIYWETKIQIPTFTILHTARARNDFTASK